MGNFSIPPPPLGEILNQLIVGNHTVCMISMECGVFPMSHKRESTAMFVSCV